MSSNNINVNMSGGILNSSLTNAYGTSILPMTSEEDSVYSDEWLVSSIETIAYYIKELLVDSILSSLPQPLVVTIRYKNIIASNSDATIYLYFHPTYATLKPDLGAQPWEPFKIVGKGVN